MIDKKGKKTLCNEGEGKYDKGVRIKIVRDSDTETAILRIHNRYVLYEKNSSRKGEMRRGREAVLPREALEESEAPRSSGMEYVSLSATEEMSTSSLLSMILIVFYEQTEDTLIPMNS